MNLPQVLEMLAQMTNECAEAMRAKESLAAAMQSLEYDRDYYLKQIQELQDKLAAAPADMMPTFDKIQMIKNLRSFTGIGLAESKKVVDIILSRKLPYAEDVGCGSLGELLREKLASMPVDGGTGLL